MPCTPRSRALLLAALLTGAATASAALAGERPAAPPAETAAKAAAPAAQPAPAATPDASPWEHPLWHNATTMMRIYLCDHSRRPPSWCSELHELPANVELPEPQGPPLDADDARWLTFLEQTDPANLSAADVATIRRRAVERRDPQAMEILGFLYAQGEAVARDYVQSYRWYGRAYLAGETRVRANMDIVWQQLQRHDLQGALALTREFDALAAGEAPPGLAPATAGAGGRGGMAQDSVADR